MNVTLDTPERKIIKGLIEKTESGEIQWSKDVDYFKSKLLQKNAISVLFTASYMDKLFRVFIASDSEAEVINSDSPQTTPILQIFERDIHGTEKIVYQFPKWYSPSIYRLFYTVSSQASDLNRIAELFSKAS